MSKKQEIYTELMRLTMPMVRNTLSFTFIYGKQRRSALAIAELTHNLYVSILNEEFENHDLHILNHQARWYYENAPRDYMYNGIILLIKELFDILPMNLRNKLDWPGPTID